MLKYLKLALGLSAAVIAFPVCAKEGYADAADVTRLKHVYVIMMENHGYGQIIGNPNAPFANAWAAKANLATNYFGVGHPSSTNYLEVVGGSNFGVRSDNPPDWHNASCQPNLATGVANTDNPASGPVCPIRGVGTDAATPVVDCTNEYTSPQCGNDIDGVKGYKADPNIEGKTIADQLASARLTIKDYQEDLPLSGPDKVNYSNGLFSNLTDFTKITPTLNPPLTNSDIVQLYAAKHNPFAYFANNQTGHGPVPFSDMVGFDGNNGLWADLAAGKSPTFSFIVPNQCHDQHGRGNGGPFCNFDPNDNGTQAGLNPALIQAGDLALEKIVTAIKASPSWSDGRNAIFAVWDENDFSVQPNVNRVLMIVDTNFGPHPVQSDKFYTHFSLLKTIEGALGLPCLNHACDSDTAAMTDLIGRRKGD
jgi:hypothetical protein